MCHSKILLTIHNSETDNIEIIEIMDDDSIITISDSSGVIIDNNILFEAGKWK